MRRAAVGLLVLAGRGPQSKSHSLAFQVQPRASVRALCAHAPTGCSKSTEFKFRHRPNVEPQLPARLEAVRSLCARPRPSGNSTVRVVADIACDHCTLGIALLRSGVAERVIGVDVCETPLQTGRAKADRKLPPSLRSRLELRLGDGFEPLTVADGVDTVCVVGVGAQSILQILDPGALPGEDIGPTGRRLGASITVCTAASLGVSRLVLQPVDSRPHHMAPLRRWLRLNGWTVVDETLRGGGRRPLYLTVLAEKTSGASFESSGSSYAEEKECLLQGLVLPRALRQRVHDALRAQAALGPNKNREATVHNDNRSNGLLKEPLSQEVALWLAYVKLHRDWVQVSRFDAYDKASGMPPGSIANALRAECDALSELGVELL